VTAYGSIDVDPMELQKSFDSDGKYLTEQLQLLLTKNTFGKLHTDHVVVSMPTARTYSRSITLPSDLNGKVIDDAVRIEAEQYIPIPMSQLYIDYEVTNHDASSISALLCAVPQRLVDVCVISCAALGLKVVMVEAGMSAVARLLKQTENGGLATIIVDIGSSSTDVAILDEGSIRVTGGVPVGGNTFTLDISNRMKVPLETAHQLKVLNGINKSPQQAGIKHALDPSLKRIVAEIKKIIRYYQERVTTAHKIEQIIIVGGGSTVPGLGDYFTDSLVLAARVASPWQVLNFGKLPQPAKQFKARYITAAGLATVDPKEIWK